MSSQLIKHVRDEIEALQAGLEEDPRYVKLRALQSVLGLYDESLDQTPNSGLASLGRNANETRTEIVQKVETYLEHRVEPTPTRVILSHLQAHGIEIGGKDKISNLSAMLSNAGVFVANGRQGWTLKQDENSSGDHVDIVTTISAEDLDDEAPPAPTTGRSFLTDHFKPKGT